MNEQIPRSIYRSVYGPTVGDRVRLGDTGLHVQVEVDDVEHGDEILGGCGKTWRDGFFRGAPATESELDLLISNVVLIDPILGVRKTSIGIKDGRVVGVGRSGAPDVVAGVDLVVGPHTALIPGEGLIATPGAIDSHVHLSAPTLVDVALSCGITTIVGMGMGGVWDCGVNPARHLELMTEAFSRVPMNVSFLARGSTSSSGAMEMALAAGASGFKVHEDFGATPALIDACLSVAANADVAVALHTDSLNEFGYLDETVDAIAGRAVHAYHVEGGGGHPNLLEILNHANVFGSSTTPTIPYTTGTVAELYAMIMTAHRQHEHSPGDRSVTESRIHPRGIQAESILHHLGAIPIINSDSMGMGRIGEMVRRTWQLAGHRGLRSASELTENEVVRRFLAKITWNPAIVHGLSEHVGSLIPGRLADVVLWEPARFGAKPELVLKAGFVAWGVGGSGNGSTRLSQPRRYTPFFGAYGDVAAELSVTFVATQALEGGMSGEGRSQGRGKKRCVPVVGSAAARREQMIGNGLVPKVVVPNEGPLLIDGVAAELAPLDRVSLGQSMHLA